MGDADTKRKRRAAGRSLGPQRERAAVFLLGGLFEEEDLDQARAVDALDDGHFNVGGF